MLYCIALKQSDSDMFLVEADNEEHAIGQLRTEIESGGTPERKRFAGGSVSHKLDGYRVVRIDNGMDMVSWNQRHGAPVEAHGVSSQFGRREISALVEADLIFQCAACGGEQYHPTDPRMMLDTIRAIASSIKTET